MGDIVLLVGTWKGMFLPFFLPCRAKSSAGVCCGQRQPGIEKGAVQILLVTQPAQPLTVLCGCLLTMVLQNYYCQNANDYFLKSLSWFRGHTWHGVNTAAVYHHLAELWALFISWQQDYSTSAVIKSLRRPNRVRAVGGRAICVPT